MEITATWVAIGPQFVIFSEMKDSAQIRKFIEKYSFHSDLILCTLVGKQGSSYRGIGSKKVVSLDGKSEGLLSGGCLEGDIERTARERIQDLPFVASFSTMAEEDRLMGYQTGCQGVIEVLFEKVPRPTDQDSNWHDQLDLMIPFGVNPKAYGVRVRLRGDKVGERQFVSLEQATCDDNTLIEPWLEPIHLVIIGCGADADAYIPLAHSLGWSLQLMDYRSDLTKLDRFKDEMVEYVPLTQMAERVPQGRSVAVVLMTHNYEADLEIVKNLRHHRIGYLGCLGPKKRFERMEQDLWSMHDLRLPESFKDLIHAPIGVFTHSNSPEAIALSVVAEIQEKLVESRQENIWTLILAAGASKRFGSAKALATWNGMTFIGRSLDTAQSFSGPSTMVVTGGYYEQIQSHLQGCHHVFNDQWSEGMGTSIARGVKEILCKDPKAEFIAILPVDQPFVKPSHLKALLSESKKTGRCALTLGDDFMGPPAVVPKRLFEKTLLLRGDQGLKSVLQASEIIGVEGHHQAEDIDTPAELLEHPMHRGEFPHFMGKNPHHIPPNQN